MLFHAPRISAVLLLAGLGTIPGVAQAAVQFGLVPQSIAQSVSTGTASPCFSALAPSLGTSRNAGAAYAAQKSAAILGGRMSKLEMITARQAGEKTLLAAAAPAAIGTAAPVIGGMSSANCQRLALPGPATPVASMQRAIAQADPQDFLASKRLVIRKTSFDSSWERVKRQSLPSSIVRGISDLASGSVDRSMLAAVNSWANARIRYVEDRELYGRADYWANASSTLRRRAGDCEDIAIVKMQLLAAAGVPRSDMYLTIARDLVRNADHAVLVVNLDGRYWLLDNATNELLDGRLGHDYRPIMSFSADSRWLHGYSQL